jgi:hypothetical protein
LCYPHKNFNQVLVVLEVNLGKVNTLVEIFLFLLEKHVFVEEELQVLVGDVDAELLEAVHLKVLKPGHVQNGYRRIPVQVVSKINGISLQKI